MAGTASEMAFSTPSETEILMTRRFAAPRAMVFNAFTDPAHIVMWWGPRRLTVSVEKFELRPGGEWRITQRDQNGKEFRFNGIYKEIVWLSKIVRTFEFAGAPGHVSEETAIFTDDGAGTVVTLRSRFMSRADRDAMLQGAKGGIESMERLDELLASGAVKADGDYRTAVEETAYVQTRLFNAPRELVFACWTDPAHMARWWGPHQFSNPVCELDPRVGGKWRIVMRGPDGSEHPAFGTFIEVVPPEKLVMSMDHSELSEEWHDMVTPGRDRSKGKPRIDARMTVLFEAVGGKTRLTIRQSFESAAILASLLKIGMTQGWAQSLERLDAEVERAAHA